MPTYLFVLSPPFSGSTVLYRLIASSANTSTLFGHGNWAGEGQFIPSVAAIMRTPGAADPRAGGFWDPALTMPWDQIKQEWDKYWDQSKAIHAEKSPPNICRAKQIQEYFSKFGEVYFVVLIRDPYSCKQRAELWVDQANFQEQNISDLEHVIWMTYEDLCADPDAAARRITGFLPELGQLSFDHKIEGVMGERAESVSNKNTCTKSLAAKRNETLKEHERLVRFFGYRLLDPEQLPSPQPELEVEQSINASPDSIVKAWTDEASLERWWIKASLDPVSRRYELTTHVPDKQGRQQQTLLTGLYSEVRTDETRFVMSIDKGCIDVNLDESRVEVEIAKSSFGSRVIVRHLQVPRSLFSRIKKFWEAQLSVLESHVTASSQT